MCIVCRRSWRCILTLFVRTSSHRHASGNSAHNLDRQSDFVKMSLPISNAPVLAIGHKHGSFWNDELVGFVKESLLIGLTRREIATEMGVSTNAICGKAWRLQLAPAVAVPKRNAPPPRSARPAPRPPRPVASKPKGEVKPPRPAKPEPTLPGKRPVPFLKRRPGQCACILDARGKDGLPFCCGAAVIPRKSWCAAHYAIFFDIERMHYGKTR